MKAKRIPKWPWMRHGKLSAPPVWWDAGPGPGPTPSTGAPRICVVSNGAIMLTCQFKPWLKRSPWERASRGGNGPDLWRRARGAWRRPGRRWTFGGTWGDIDVIDIGAMTVQARYFDLVERLYPGCRWKIPKLGSGPAQAHQDGRVVASVMPMATDRYLRRVWPRFGRGAAR